MTFQDMIDRDRKNRELKAQYFADLQSRRNVRVKYRPAGVAMLIAAAVLTLTFWAWVAVLISGMF